MKILVPFDFSAFSIKALKYATALAVKTNATIELIHVIELPVISDPLSVFNFDNALKDELKQNTLKEFDKVIKEFGTQSVKIGSAQLFGPISATILDYARAKTFDLIIMGSHGASKFSEFLLGSNAMRIIRRSIVPVMTIKDQLHRQIRSIVFPHNLEIEGQDALIEKVTELQTTFDAHLHLVSVNSPLAFTSDEVYKARLETFLDHFKLVNFTARIYNHEDFATGIIKYAKSVDADLIMMATHGRTGVSGLINTSVAEDVIHKSVVPVWTLSTRNLAALAT